MRHVSRGGEYLRVADPAWRDPLSGEYSRRRGGRWNAPGAFPVVYLNASRELARAQVLLRLDRRGIRPEDLRSEAGPVLVQAVVPDNRYADAVSERGLRSLGLPASYPRDSRGRPVPHSVCRPIGERAWRAGEPGIACRSAARAAPTDGEELAYFARRRLRRGVVEQFADWYW